MEEKLNKIVFVILHYYTINDTIKCVNSIKEKLNNKNYEIIIVDNASKNNTGEELKQLYNNVDNIHIIINKENLGFAKGNNIGFQYAKEKLNPDYIALLNNDTVILQDNFLELVVQEYKETEFDVLGPQILLPDGSVNPIMHTIPGMNELKKSISNTKLELIRNYIFINRFYKYIRQAIKNILIKLKIKKSSDILVKDDTNKRYENIVLHGCFLIFSKRYIEKFNGLDDRTFLYREEELLAIRLRKNGLRSIYNPNLKILHNEDGATNAINKSNRKKEIFICKNQIKSMKILLKELNN